MERREILTHPNTFAKAFALFLIFLSNTLSADWRGWLEWNEPEAPTNSLETHSIISKVREFQCPHHYEEWGSKGIQKIEWEFIGLMFQADKINTFLNENGKPYAFEYDAGLHTNHPIKFDFPYEKPQDFNSEWYEEMVRFATQGGLGRLVISDQLLGKEYSEYFPSSRALDKVLTEQIRKAIKENPEYEVRRLRQWSEGN